MTNGLNQYTSAGQATFGYDLNGNLTSVANPPSSTSYVYDVENRLVSASGASSAALVYDPLGRLFQTSGGPAGITQFFHDDDALIAEYNSAGTMLRRYVHGSDKGVDDPLIWYENLASGWRRALVADQQGSIVAVADMYGNPLAINAYDEYGIPKYGNVGRFGYTGQAWIPELGMYYYKARIYSPTLGRFLQVDPIGYDDQINLYAYVGNDPVNKNDPEGMFESHWLLRAIVPGQVAWDNAVTAVEQGRYGAAAGHVVVMVGEQVATVLTGGVGRTALGARSSAAQRAAVANWRAAQRTSLQKSERSLLANVQEHKQKIAQYRANPASMDNKGVLARARSPAERQQIIAGRLNALQKQLAKNQNELQKVRDLLGSLK